MVSLRSAKPFECRKLWIGRRVLTYSGFTEHRCDSKRCPVWPIAPAAALNGSIVKGVELGLLCPVLTVSAGCGLGFVYTTGSSLFPPALSKSEDSVSLSCSRFGADGFPKFVYGTPPNVHKRSASWGWPSVRNIAIVCDRVDGQACRVGWALW